PRGRDAKSRVSNNGGSRTATWAHSCLKGMAGTEGSGECRAPSTRSIEDQMLNKLRRRAEDEKGFTLIELLVVILIIGILAAIAIPAFLNQKGKAYDSNAKSDARTAATAEETYYTDNNGYTATVTDLTAIEPTLN